MNSMIFSRFWALLRTRQWPSQSYTQPRTCTKITESGRSRCNYNVIKTVGPSISEALIDISRMILQDHKYRRSVSCLKPLIVSSWMILHCQLSQTIPILLAPSLIVGNNNCTAFGILNYWFIIRDMLRLNRQRLLVQNSYEYSLRDHGYKGSQKLKSESTQIYVQSSCECIALEWVQGGKIERIVRSTINGWLSSH